MFDQLRCSKCGEKGHLYMWLSGEFSSFYCRNCDLAFHSEEVAEFITCRSEGRARLNSAKTVEQIAECQKVLDFILGG